MRHYAACLMLLHARYERCCCRRAPPPISLHAPFHIHAARLLPKRRWHTRDSAFSVADAPG